MISNDQPLRSQMIERMINHFIKQDPDDLSISEWEKDFIFSVNEQFQRKGDLSNKQCEILEKIYDK